MKRESVLEKPANPRLAVTRKSSPLGEAVSSPKLRDIMPSRRQLVKTLSKIKPSVDWDEAIGFKDAGVESAAGDLPVTGEFPERDSKKALELRREAYRVMWTSNFKRSHLPVLQEVRFDEGWHEGTRWGHRTGYHAGFKAGVESAHGLHKEEYMEWLKRLNVLGKAFEAGKQVECERAWNVVSEDARGKFAREALKRLEAAISAATDLDGEPIPFTVSTALGKHRAWLESQAG
jgi:hypothetical protein